MGKHKKKKPEIRFKGFTDDWEQRKVTELGKIYIGLVTTMTKHYTDDGTLLIRNSDIKDGIFEFNANPIFLEKSFAKANESRMHQLGDVITVHTGDVGTSAVITKNEEKSIGFATIVTRPNKAIIYTYYLCVFLNTEKHKKWAVAISTGDGRTNYNLGDYFKLIVPVPSIKEQKKIASVIENLNNLITLHQRKLNKLKKVKNSMLEKMFPQNGEMEPQIRFCGFNSTWEQRKLDGLYEKNTEKNVDLIGYEKTISIATMTYKNEGNGASTASLAGYKVLRLGDIAFEGHTNKEFRFGRFVVNDIGIGIMSPRFATLRPKKYMSVDFWKYYIHYEAVMRNILVNATKAGTMMNELVIPEFLNQELRVPPEGEQKQIGEYFDKLDHLITLHQRKLEKLKKIKKAMLEKMFV